MLLQAKEIREPRPEEEEDIKIMLSLRGVAPVSDSAQSSPVGAGGWNPAALLDLYALEDAPAEPDPTPSVSPLDKKPKEAAAAKGSAAAVQQKREEEKAVGKARPRCRLPRSLTWRQAPTDRV